MIFIMVGPPGSGKGTHSKRIAEKFNLLHVSTGEMLRNLMNPEIKELIDAGKFVPDSVVISMIEEILQDNPKGVVFDGFPRTVAQAEELQKLLKKYQKNIDGVFELQVAENVLLQRILERAESHKLSGKTVRSDDNPEVFSNRMKIYREKTAPIMEFYKHITSIWAFDSSLALQDVSRQIDEAVGEYTRWDSIRMTDEEFDDLMNSRPEPTASMKEAFVLAEKLRRQRKKH